MRTLNFLFKETEQGFIKGSFFKEDSLMRESRGGLPGKAGEHGA